MAKKRFLLGIPVMVLVFGLVMTGCTVTTAYRADDSAATIEQAKAIELHEIQPGETVKELVIERKGSLQVDLSTYEGGTWYNAHKDKIVSIQAVEKHEVRWPVPKVGPMWRIQYVD